MMKAKRNGLLLVGVVFVGVVAALGIGFMSQNKTPKYAVEFEDYAMNGVTETAEFVDINTEKYDYEMNGKDNQKVEETALTNYEVYYHFNRAYKNYGNMRVKELVAGGMDETEACKKVLDEIVDIEYRNSCKFAELSIDADENDVADAVDNGSLTEAEYKYIEYICDSADALTYEFDLSKTEAAKIEEIQGKR